VEYVTLKGCRTLFSAANEFLFELTGEKKGAYEDLDGVFTGIWTALADYPDWTVLLLDEIDHVQHDINDDPTKFVYRLLRGEGNAPAGSIARSGSSVTNSSRSISDWTAASQAR